MANEYVKLTLSVICKSSDEDEVISELNQSLDSIGMEHRLFEDEISSESADTPEDADEDEDVDDE